jgi:8-oxo-dGTP diphosphatase
VNPRNEPPFRNPREPASSNPGAGTAGSNPREPIVVVAAIIERDDRFLLTLRQPDTHLAGHWEFPGGKCDPSETHAEALRRELHEELDIVAEVGACVFQITHDYRDRSVSLYFYQCTFAGVPKPMLGQGMAWVGRAELPTLPFPEADRALIDRLVASA